MDGEIRRATEVGAVRVTVIGVRRTLESPWAAGLSPDLKVEFAPAVWLQDGGGEFPFSCDAVLLDAHSPEPGERKALVERALAVLRARAPQLRPLVVVEPDDAETAQAAVAAGAWDLVGPEIDGGQIGARLRQAARLGRLGAELAAMDPPADQDPKAQDDRQMVGTSAAMRQVFSMIRRVSRADVPVLITGASGTGKELTALAIHERSARSQAPFVPINCSAIPETLLEAELFGHEKGAFTGATHSRRGRFEAAQGGTLFLDEIGELAHSVQVKLLRFLENHVVERVGGRRSLQLDVRVIAATNRDLGNAVEEGRFREDLYYRLAVFTVDLPLLRERGDDVLVMAKYYLDRYARQAGRTIEGFSPHAKQALLCAPWPGNVRELINRVRRAVVMAEGARITASDLGFEGGGGDDPLPTLREARSRAELDCLVAVLRRAGGNKSEAARLLGIGRTQLYELMRRHGLGATA